MPEAVTRLLEQHPDASELEKREADVSVLFLDVEGYTRLSEQLPPPRLNRMIQDYFSAFLEIIRAQHGDVNETAGDGLMVIFQSDGSQTRHALNAAGAAFRLLARVAQLNRELGRNLSAGGHSRGHQQRAGPRRRDEARRRRGRAVDLHGLGAHHEPRGPHRRPHPRRRGEGRPGDGRAHPGSVRPRGHREHPLKNVAQPVRIYRLVPAGIYARVE